MELIGRSNLKSFVVQTITGSWFMLFASFLVMSMTGIPYIFGLYSGTIKSVLGYDQTTLNFISFFKDVGTSVGIHAGLINEVAPTWAVLAIGATLNFFGYFMIWLSVTEKVPKPDVWLICLYICLSANATIFANTGALVTCVKTYPKRRGVVIGILKGYMGLSGAIVTQFYHAIYGNDAKALLLLLGWLPTAISFVFLPTIRTMKPTHQPNELKVFFSFLYVSLGLAGFLMIMIIFQQKFSFTHVEYNGSAAAVVLLLVLPIAIVVGEEFKLWKTKMLVVNDDLPPKIIVTQNTDSPISQHISSKLELEKPIFWWQNVFHPPKRGDDFTILQALFSIDMLILFITTACGIGGTLTAIDNLGQIGASHGYPKKSISTFVSLVSIWNYLGRVFSGFVSEILLTKYKFPRPLMLTGVLLLACVGHLLIAFNPPGSLYAASIITGFCYGAQWPLLYTIVSEIFGLKYYATLFNFGSVASPVGLYVLNVKVAGNFYDREAKKQLEASGIGRKVGEALNCTGLECFKWSFIIVAAASLFGMFVSMILVIRTRKFYQSDIYKKFSQETKVEENEMEEKTIEG